ncbi:H2.0-like homeobox protein [Halotydeus destructor]|nr:H2.0-like homeobox protein [Halotydeus destructor]KAI1298449.1 H2.0-like homeobox protein [Halotydeus destructor]
MSNMSNKCTSSMKLNFGVDRLLLKDGPQGGDRGDHLSTLNCSPGSEASVTDMANLYLRYSTWPHSFENYVQDVFYIEHLLANRQAQEWNCHSLLTESPTLELNSSKLNLNLSKKKTWSRAVFSSIQRKGLEKYFSTSKYISKQDRRKLADSLGLSDSQVKVWFQNRRMKWRHSKEYKEQLDSEKSNLLNCSKGIAA